LPAGPVPGFEAERWAPLVSVVVVALAAVVAVLDLTGSSYLRVLASLTMVLVTGAFLWPLPSDPVVAGAVIALALYGFGRMVFDAPALSAASDPLPSETPAARILQEQGPALRHLLAVSIAIGVCVVGYGFERRVPALAIAAGFALLVIAAAGRLLYERLRQRSKVALVALVFAIAGVAVGAAAGAGTMGGGRPWPGLALLLGAQVLLLLLARHEGFIRDLIDGLYERPAALVVASFVGLILLGTLLLSFPAASSTGRSIGLTNALFTATSAACVTGLIVLDTSTAFSSFGQAVILALLQVGGLNIMVLSTFAALLLGRGLGLRGERALGDVLDIATPGAAYRLIAFIIKLTFIVELIGAAGMAAAYTAHGYAPGPAAWYGLFHAVSAFCNAGFALQSDSLVMFREQPLPLLLMALLITLGGLGFAVLSVLWRDLRERRLHRMAIQTRIVLAASGIFVAVGFIGYLAGEWSGSLAGLSLPDKLVNALFQSVTLRTAGFNSVSFDALRPVTLLWMLAFMFVGASPGGTGGGIKTTTAVVLFAAIPAFLRRRRSVVLQERSITAHVVHQSTAIAVASVTVVLVGALLLVATQPMSFEQLVFEAFSAFGTVGLSLGVTGRLDAFGKLVVVLVMLIGRVGPLAITLLLAREDASRVTYPEARIMVG
jgi:trk system potassium uptake protein TrkH